jgi:hypothetical protein
MSWLKQIATGLLLQRTRFNPSPVHVGFVVNYVAMGQALLFSEYFFSPSAPFYLCPILLQLLPSNIISATENVIK